MRSLVTGGAGFVGSNLALELERLGLADVVVLDNFSVGTFTNLRGFRGDVVAADAQSDAWHDKVGKVDAVFHQAANTDTTVMDQRAMMEANVEGLRSVLSFAKRFGVKRVVYASSAGVYGNSACPMREDQRTAPENVYGFSKAVGDELARTFWRANPHTTVVGLRYFNVFGPRESHKGKAASMIWQLSRQILEGRRPRIFKFGEQSRDFIYVKDVVEANLKGLACAESGVFNIGTGRAETFNTVIDELNSTLGTDRPAEYFDNPYAFFQNKTQADTKLAAETLGFKAGFTLAGGIADYFAGVRAGGAKAPKAARKAARPVKV